MSKNNSDANARDYFEFAAGALVYGAEQVCHLGVCAAKGAKRFWDTHETEREAAVKKLSAYKEKFLSVLSKRGENISDFDQIVARLDRLTPEERETLKTILK